MRSETNPSKPPDLAPWLRLEFDCGPEQIEAAADLLERFGASAISIAPIGETVIEEAPGQVAYAASNRVGALLVAGTDLDILLACLRNRLGAGHIDNVIVEPVKDRNWNAEFRAAHGPLSFGGRLCICPGWAAPLPGQHVVWMDPGLAFGTGTHATTALCLDWLACAPLRGLDLIDYGCGSGVLALSAAVLGARRVLALDIDPDAVEVARQNVGKNGLEAAIQVAVCGPELPPADILVANILLKPLMELAPMFSVLVKPRGRIALSGILASQAGECAAAFRPWFDLAPPEFREEWALLHGTRKAAAGGSP